MVSLNVIPTEGRQCGDCQACCEILEINVLNKPQWKKCVNQCEKGCAIYEDRPQPCRDWSCMWLRGYIPGDERRRPDKLGVMFDLQYQIWEKFGVQLLTAYEVWDGAFQQAGYFLNKLAEKYPIMLIKRDGTYSTLPPSVFSLVS